MNKEFSLRAIAIPAFGPSVMFGIAEGAIFPVIAITSIQLGADLALASGIMAIIGIGSLLANIPASLFTHRFGEKKAIIGASFISMIAMILAMTVSQLVVFCFANVLVGIAQAVFNLARQKYLTEAVPFHQRARALSTLGGSYRIGVFIGPFASAGAMHFLGIHGAYLVGLFGSLGALIIAFSLADLTPSSPGFSSTKNLTLSRIFRSHIQVFITIGVGILAVSAVRSCRQLIIPLWGHNIGLDPQKISMIYGVSAAIDMLLFYPAGKVMDHYGRNWVALPAMLMMTAGFFLMPFTSEAKSLLCVALVLGFGNGISSGLVMTLGADFSPAEGRAKFLGIWRFMQDVGSGLGPLMISTLTALVSLAAGISSAGILSVLAAVIIGYWSPRLAHQQITSGKNQDKMR